MSNRIDTEITTPAERWVPTRAGIVGLWRYWDETFTFHRGRLLLTGPNGTGKSMALEMLLPFLLDADASASRLSTGTKSRGTLFERVMGGSKDASRTGFAWVEFRRGDETFAVGVRVRATASTRKVDLDFFTTDQVVGVELRLLDEGREPLSRKALAQAIGDHGAVHPSATEHRAAVRERLFPGFSADRYASVVTALLALRKEKLSSNLDLDKLSRVLTESLPQLDEHDLAVVAEGFERLDRRRTELAALDRELEEIKVLARRQRQYARAVVARVARDVRSAETRRDDVTRWERDASKTLEDARRQAEGAAKEIDHLAKRLLAIAAEVDALKESDAYREGIALEDLRRQEQVLRGLVEQTARDVRKRKEEHEATAREVAEASADRQQAVENLNVAIGDLHRAAMPVGAGMVAHEAMGAPIDEGEAVVKAWLRERRDDIVEARRELGNHRGVVARRSFASEAVDAADQTVIQRTEAKRTAERRRLDEIRAFAASVQAWAGGCTAMGPERVMRALPAPPDHPTAVARSIERLASEIASEHGVLRHELGATRKEIDGELADLAAERDSLAEGAVVEPDAPLWRTERARTGAPLWRLVDAAEGVSRSSIDGIESALVAAGLLDAWVSADGSVDLPEGTADVVLARRPIDGRTLADFLVPLSDGPVEVEIVRGALASIQVSSTVDASSSDVVIATDGTFRLGAARGRGPQRAAALLGVAAQERRRLARLAEIDGRVADLEVRSSELARQMEGLDARERAVQAEIEAAPDGAAVADAEQYVLMAGARLAEAEETLATARRAVAEAEEAVRRSLRTLTALCDRHQLPTDDVKLTEVEAGLSRFDQASSTCVHRRRDVATAERFLDRARRADERAGQRASEASEHLKRAERDADQVTIRVQTLQATFGAEYLQLQDQIESLETERRKSRAREEEVRASHSRVERQIGGLGEKLESAQKERERADEARLLAHGRFAESISAGLADDAAVTLAVPLDGITAVLVAARSLAVELEKVGSDDEAIERASAAVVERLHHARAALGGRVDLVRERSDGGWWTLLAATSGVRRSTSALVDVLEAELEAGRVELVAEEERLFEQTLAGSVRRALAERIRLANHLVEGINKQLEAIRTAAGGVSVRLRWDVDPEQQDVVKAARALLLRDPATLTDGERGALQTFVKVRVEQARADLEQNAPWEARLRETLDYRAWHRFTLQISHRDWDGFKTATPRLLERLSTGERSIALHLPMLASLAAHYADEDGQPSTCPRLILLDELFVGVDAANRAQLFGTFSAWQMGAVFTSDHEWCQYATLDGIAIHHMHPAVDDGPVTSTRFTWDGRERVADTTLD